MRSLFPRLRRRWTESDGGAGSGRGGTLPFVLRGEVSFEERALALVPLPLPFAPPARLRGVGGGGTSTGGETPEGGASATGTPPPPTRTPISPVQPEDPAAKNFPEPQAAPSNIGGVCDERLQPVIADALRGDLDDDELVAEADPLVWSFATVLPIMQDTGLVGASHRIEGTMAGRTGLASQLFLGAAGWHRTVR